MRGIINKINQTGGLDNDVRLGILCCYFYLVYNGQL